MPPKVAGRKHVDPKVVAPKQVRRREVLQGADQKRAAVPVVHRVVLKDVEKTEDVAKVAVVRRPPAVAKTT